MNDERDLETRRVAREDHALWLSQHRGWAAEAEGWLQQLEDHERTLAELQTQLDSERKLIEAHLDGIRRHEAAITEHEFVLAELDGGTCGGCEEAEPPTHSTSAARHGRQSTAHLRLAERQSQVAEALARLVELVGE